MRINIENKFGIKNSSICKILQGKFMAMQVIQEINTIICVDRLEITIYCRNIVISLVNANQVIVTTYM